jgi:hypothetical protein
MKQPKTFKIYGESVGDRSVGISGTPFELDTGILIETEEQKKQVEEMINSKLAREKYFKNRDIKTYKDYLIFLIGKLIYELHDNGDVRLDTNINPDEWYFPYRVGYNEIKKKIEI